MNKTTVVDTTAIWKLITAVDTFVTFDTLD